MQRTKIEMIIDAATVNMTVGAFNKVWRSIGFLAKIRSKFKWKKSLCLSNPTLVSVHEVEWVSERVSEKEWKKE